MRTSNFLKKCYLAAKINEMLVCFDVFTLILFFFDQTGRTNGKTFLLEPA